MAVRRFGFFTGIVVLTALWMTPSLFAQTTAPSGFDSSLFTPYDYTDDPDRPEYTCDANYSWVDQAPFMITDAYNNGGRMPSSRSEYERNWDNFRLEEDSLSIVGFLPQRSIVRVLDPNFDQVKADTQPDRDRVIAVEVLNVPENASIEMADEMPGILKDILKSNDERVKPGQRGRVHEDVLQQASGFTYLIRDNTFLRQIPGLDDVDIEAAKAVEPVSRMRGDKPQYEARRCCLKTDASRCIYKHRFRILDKDLNELKTAEVDLEICDILDGVRPVDKDQALAILRVAEAAQSTRPGFGIDDVEYIDSMGLIKFPFTYEEVGGDEMIEGPYNTSHYKPDGRTAEARRTLSDSYINATTGCALTEVLRKWNQQNPQEKYEIQFGNMWHPQAWGIHDTHEIRDDHGGAQGTCFDIRPPSKTSRREALTHNGNNRSSYDRKQTRAFARLLKAAGADTIIFNDSKVKERTNRRNVRNHDDHLHICMNPNSETVKNTCREGL
jgi:hypothetical protein